MKILSIANKLPYPPHDGGAIGFLNPLLGLADAGNDVTLLTFNTSRHYFPLDQVPDTIKNKIRIIDFYINTSINPVKACINLFCSRMPYNIERFKSKTFAKLLEDILKKESFDIIQIEGLYMAQYIPVVRKNSDAKIVYRSHNIEHEIWKRLYQNEKNKFKKLYIHILSKRIKNLEKNTVNTYDALVPVTDRDARIFNQLGNIKPVHVTLPGWELPQNRKYEPPANMMAVFHIGALDWFPNQEGLVWFIDKVWPDIIKNKPNAHFYIAGRNAPAWLIEKTKKEQITFLGEVDNSARFISDNNIMVVPLLSGSGIRIKCIEGMSLGRTIVTTSVGIEGIPAIQGVHSMIADNPNEFARCVINLLNNPDLCIQIGKNAFNFALQNFDLKILSEKLTGFYKSLIINR